MNFTIKKLISGAVTLYLVLSIGHVPQSYADGFMKPGVRYMLSNRDYIFEVCNHSGQPLSYAIIYKNYWKWGEPPTWPAKGWFRLARGGCENVAINGLFGVMSVMTDDLKPYFSNGTDSLKNVETSGNQVKKFKAEYFCIGKKIDDAFKETYRDDLYDYRKCAKGQGKIPFNVIFNIKGDRNYTLNLN